MRVLSDDCLPDVLCMLDRLTLDTLLVADMLLEDVVSTRMNGVCLREIAEISVERRIEYGDFNWKIEVPKEDPDSPVQNRFEVSFLMRDMKSSLSGVFKNCFVSDHIVLHHVILTPGFLDIFASLFKGVRVRGFLSLHDISAPASVSVKQLIDAFDEVKTIVLRGQKFLQEQLNDAFLQGCFDKGAAVVDFPYGRNACLPHLSTDAILDFCFGSGDVAASHMAWRRNRSVTVQGVVLPNDFVRKCVEKHLACPFTNSLSIQLRMAENMDHQELDEVAAYTDPSRHPFMNPFKISLVTRGMKLRINGFKIPAQMLALLPFPPDASHPVVSVQRALESEFDFIFRNRAFRGGRRPVWMR